MLFLNLLTFLVVGFGSGYTSELIGYDCGHPRANTTVISLSTVDECSGNSSSNTINSVYVQILQTRKYSDIWVRSCLVTHSYIIFRCGSGSSNYITKFGFGTDEVLTVERAECMRMFAEGKWETPWGHHVKGIKANHTRTVRIHESGDNDEYGYCNTGSNPRDYTINGIHYEQVFVAGSFKITLKESIQSLDRSSHLIHLSSGYRYPVFAGEGFDTTLGNVFWTLPESEDRYGCTPSSHMLVYEGPAFKITSPGNTAMLVVNSTNRALALDLEQPGVFCGYDGFITSHPRIIVLESKNYQPMKAGFREVLPEEIDSELHLNAKLGYMSEFFNQELTSLYSYVRKQDCQIRLQLLHQLTSLALISPEDFAWSYAKRPGVTAMLSGEAVYLLECVPMVVSFSPSPHCYQEIPVLYKNSTKYLKPRSRIMVDYGTQLPCNPLAPPLFVIDGAWYQLHPTPHQVPSPIILHSDPTETWKSRRLSNLMATGLYTQEDMEKYQKRLLFPLEQPAIQQIITSRAGGVDVERQRIDLMDLIDEDRIKLYQESLFKRVYGWVWHISMQFAGFFGFISLLMIIRYLIHTVVTGTLLYQVYGISAKILLAITGSLGVNILTLLKHRDDQKRTDSNPPTEQEMVMLPKEAKNNDHEEGRKNAPMYPILV